MIGQIIVTIILLIIGGCAGALAMCLVSVDGNDDDMRQLASEQLGKDQLTQEEIDAFTAGYRKGLVDASSIRGFE